MAEIIRLYSSAELARAAVARVRAEGLAGEEDEAAMSPAGTGWQVSIRPPFGTAQRATDILDSFGPVAEGTPHSRYDALNRDRPPGVDAISRLSGPVSPGEISSLSGRVDPGAIAVLSGPKSVGAIATLSSRKSPGAISRLSGPVSPGAISRLSQDKSTGTISRLSSGWYVSSLLGLPLLTASQRPIEPDASLLTDRHEVGRH